MSEIRTIAQDQPTCPYCGHRERDAWEIDFGPGCDGEAIVPCGRCDREYLVYRDCHITYNSHKTGDSDD